MKYSNLILELISAGCFLKRSGARHDIWYSPITERFFQSQDTDQKKCHKERNKTSGNYQEFKRTNDS